MEVRKKKTDLTLPMRELRAQEASGSARKLLKVIAGVPLRKVQGLD